MTGIRRLILFTLISFLGAASAFAQSPPLRVVTTLFPLQEFAQAVGRDRVKADLLLPPGAEPHSWEPRPSDLARIHQADFFLFVGGGMEPWAEGILRGVRGARLTKIEAARDIPLMPFREEHGPTDGHAHREGPADPHIWLDFSLAMKIIDAVAAAFAAKDPGHGPVYQANAAAYKALLDGLDRKFHEGLASCRHRKLILGGHSAFAYLARRYGLQQIALYGANPNAEPTPKKLAAVIRAAKTEGVRYIFFEGLVNPKTAQVLAKEAGIGTLVLSDGANLTREQMQKRTTFLGLMEVNFENLRRGLECGRP